MSDSEEVTSAASYFNSAQAPVPAPVPPANQQSAASQQLLPPALNQEYLGITNEPPPGKHMFVGRKRKQIMIFFIKNNIKHLKTDSFRKN